MLSRDAEWDGVVEVCTPIGSGDNMRLRDAHPTSYPHHDHSHRSTVTYNQRSQSGCWRERRLGVMCNTLSGRGCDVRTCQMTNCVVYRRVRVSPRHGPEYAVA